MISQIKEIVLIHTIINYLQPGFGLLVSLRIVHYFLKAYLRNKKFRKNRFLNPDISAMRRPILKRISVSF